MPDDKPLLEGIRVVEAATMIMVPSAASVMADFGAEVIKVEPLGGDMNRRGHLIPGMPKHDYEYCFLPDNRHKKSIALDLKSEEGREILLRLLEDADVFFTNYRRKALERLGLTWEELSRHNPALVYAQGTGYGDRGAEADQPGFDAVCYWARSALEATLFPLEGWLGSTGYGTGDHPSGMSLYAAVMTALFARQQTGRGCRVTTSLLANGVWSNSVLVQARLCEAEFQERRPREEALNFMAVYYRTGDERIFKLAVVDHQQGWPRICRAIERQDLIDDPRYATYEARLERMPELIAICDSIFERHDLDHWRRAFADNDVPFSVVAGYDDVVDDAQIADNGIFIDVEDPRQGRLRTVDTPFHLSAHPKLEPGPAPRLGQHCDQILTELGYDEERIAALAANGVVRREAG